MIKITIVEDLPIVLEGLRVLIGQSTDFEIVNVFANGKEFVDHINKLDTDVVLTDIDMPVMDGIMATKMAMGLQPSLKIIALSMHSDSQYYYQMVTAGAKGFVLKQAQYAELEKAIREVNAGGHYFSGELLRSVIMGMNDIESKLVEEKKHLFEFTDREIQFFALLCQGFSNKELADELCVSVRTIESIKTKLMKKTNTKNNAGLIIWAIKNQIVEI